MTILFLRLSTPKLLRSVLLGSYVGTHTGIYRVSGGFVLERYGGRALGGLLIVYRVCWFLGSSFPASSDSTGCLTENGPSGTSSMSVNGPGLKSFAGASGSVFILQKRTTSSIDITLSPRVPIYFIGQRAAILCFYVPDLWRFW